MVPGAAIAQQGQRQGQKRPKEGQKDCHAAKTGSGQTVTYSRDYRNRLTEVIVMQGGVTVQDDKFTYDLDDRRIGKLVQGGTQQWTVPDGDNPYADFSATTLTYRYLEGQAMDSLLARFDGTTTVWYLGDSLGSVRLRVNVDGTVADTLAYDSFGNVLTGTGDRFKFTGREFDSEIGQYNYRARNYSPSIGRFESEDPSGFKAGDANLYRYVHNGPTNGRDPTGLGSEYADPIRDLFKLLSGDRDPEKAAYGQRALALYLGGATVGQIVLWLGPIPQPSPPPGWSWSGCVGGGVTFGTLGTAVGGAAGGLPAVIGGGSGAIGGCIAGGLGWLPPFDVGNAATGAAYGTMGGAATGVPGAAGVGFIGGWVYGGYGAGSQVDAGIGGLTTGVGAGLAGAGTKVTAVAVQEVAGANAARIAQLEQQLAQARQALNWNLQQAEHTLPGTPLGQYFATRIAALRAEIEGIETLLRTLR